jgi:major vault protein
MADVREKRDLVLPPGSYAFMQDTTNGVIKTYVGPTVVNPTAQETPIIYNDKTHRFEKVSIEDAMRLAVVAVEGYYVVLLNPVKDNRHPETGRSQSSPDPEAGRKIIIPGPDLFALWPGQSAEVVRGHNLRSNQYLLVRVYNDEEAQKNWSKAVVKPATGETPAEVVATAPPPDDLTNGKLLIIRGTEVSFYIPPTGITVIPDESSTSKSRYVREALTLERLEYCILTAENGKKRFEIGPQVVFPLPSETFFEVKDSGNLIRKFRAIELNENAGIHIKVIADYEENGVLRKIGDELFITGKETAIYFPREEHSIIKYDGKTKSFAVAIPPGEGRYLMKRKVGNFSIDMVKGPNLLLADPRTEVIIRRPLSDREVRLWYPGNEEALLYNASLRAVLGSVPTTRTGAVSEGDFERGMPRGAGGPRSKGPGGQGVQTLGAAVQYAVSNMAAMETSRVSGDQQLVGEEFSRSSTYSSPRTLVLEAKYQGCPVINVWTGYAVMVVTKTSNGISKRRVERGPMNLLMEYDEVLEILTLSTGKPKTADRVLETPYLRVENNVVSDIIQVETSDRVNLQLYLSYQVNFEGDPMKWFSVENYVKFLCDHVRSILKGRVRKIRVEDFYADSTDIIRDILLGKAEGEAERSGMFFKENGMRVGDVEVLKVAIMDDRIRPLLEAAQHDVVRANIEISALRRNLEMTKNKEKIKQDEVTITTETEKHKQQVYIDQLASDLAAKMAEITSNLTLLEERKKEADAQRFLDDQAQAATLGRTWKQKSQEMEFKIKDQELFIKRIQAEAESIVARFSAAQTGFSEALLSLSNNETMIQVARAWDVQKVVGGESMADLLAKLFHNTPLKPLLDKLVTSPPPANGTVSAPSRA